MLHSPQVIEDNKALLKQKYDTAKAIGGAVNESKARISELKALIEQRRIQRAVAAGDLTGAISSVCDGDFLFLLIVKEQSFWLLLHVLHPKSDCSWSPVICLQGYFMFGQAKELCQF